MTLPQISTRLLALALLALGSIQAYYLYNHLAHPAYGMRITYKLGLPTGCMLPSPKQMNAGVFNELSKIRTDLVPEQIHFALISGQLTVTLPAMKADSGFFQSLGEKLSALTQCELDHNFHMNNKEGFILQQTETFRINRNRPLDYISLLSVLAFGIYLFRRKASH